jgi:hypothetical protein
MCYFTAVPESRRQLEQWQQCGRVQLEPQQSAVEYLEQQWRALRFTINTHAWWRMFAPDMRAAAYERRSVCELKGAHFRSRC